MTSNKEYLQNANARFLLPGVPKQLNHYCRKLAGVVRLWGRGARSHLAQCGQGRGLLRTKWHLDPSSSLATIDMDRKLGGSDSPHTPPSLGRGSWVPILHNVARAETYLHAKFHLDPYNRLATIHQCHRQTGQTGQDNGPIA